MVVVTVTVLRFTDNSGTVVLDSPQGWMDFVVGFNAELNIVAEARGAAFIDMPNTLPVDLQSRSPNRSGGRASLATMLRQNLPKHSDVGGGVTRYQLSESWDGLPFKKDSVREVATVVRAGKDATADRTFRASLLYTVRGFARQPFAKLNPGGKTVTFDSDLGDPNSKRETPPAESIMVSGGLEVLEARVPVAAERKVPAGVVARGLVRSPADIWFYSGHGVESGELAVGPLNGHSYAPWKEPSDFLSAWVTSGNKARTADMKIFIINGCNVLNLDSG